jgi:hypothetical protein
MILGALDQKLFGLPRVHRETPEFQRLPSIKEIETWDTIKRLFPLRKTTIKQ